MFARLSTFPSVLLKSLKRDPLFIPALLGVVTCLASFRRVVSPEGQDFSEFLKQNWPWLLGTLGGLVLYFFSNLPRVAALRFERECAAAPRRWRAPRLIFARGTEEKDAIVESGDAARLRPPSPADWLRRWWGRTPACLRYRALAGMACLLAAAGLYAYTIAHILRDPRGLVAAAAFVLSIPLAALGVALLEFRRARSWGRDAGLGRFQRGLPFWKRDMPWLLLALALWIAWQYQRIETRPGFYHFDESVVTLYGRATYAFADAGCLAPPWHVQYQPYFNCIPRSLVRDWFMPERPQLGARLYSLFMATLTLILIFLLARAHLGRLAAWIALALAATNHVQTAFARIAITNIDTLFLLCAFALAWTGAWRSRRLSLALLAGCMAGLTYYAYQSGMVVIPLVALLIAIQIIRCPLALWKRRLALAVFVIGLAATAAPMYVYYRKDPQSFRLRIDWVFLLSKENIDRGFGDSQAASLPGMLAWAAWPAVGGTLLWPDTSLVYLYKGLPMIDRATCTLFFLGLVGALALWRKRRIFELLILWCLLVLVFGAWLTREPPPPYAPRVVVMWPAMHLLCAAVLAGLIHRAARLGGKWLALPAVALPAAALVAYIGALNVYHYHFKYLNDMTNHHYRVEPTGFEEFLRRYPKDCPMILFGDYPHQLHNPQMAIWDTGWPRVAIIEHDTAIPDPDPKAPVTCYVVKVPQYSDVDKRLQERFPKVKPEDIKNLYVDLPPTYRAYWVKRNP